MVTLKNKHLTVTGGNGFQGKIPLGKSPEEGSHYIRPEEQGL